MTGLDPFAASRKCAGCGTGIQSGYVRCGPCRRAMHGDPLPVPRPPSDDGDPLAALRLLQSSGLVTGRDALNRAWAQLTAREVPDCCGGCGQPGAWPYLEPAGRWHVGCIPSLWRTDGNPMIAPKCRTCGAPGGVPNHPSGRRQKPVCREHAPAWLASYLHRPGEGNP